MRGAVPAPDWVWERYTPGHAGGGFTDSGPQAQRIQSRERSSAKRCESERFPTARFRLRTTPARPSPAVCNAARRPCAWTAHSGRNSGEFRPPFAAPSHWRANTALATHSEPRAEQREALRERAVATARFHLGLGGWTWGAPGGSERFPQHNAVPPPVSTLRAHSLQRGAAAHRVDRSLWPEFWRIPAPVRGSEPLACKHCPGNAFRAASGAARSAAGASGCPQRVSAGASAAGRGQPPAGASGCHASCFRLRTTPARPAPAACNAARRPCAWTAHSGRNSGEFRPPFAALTPATPRSRL
jgi:hypothetical protein